jgi:hypothetical protein
MIYLSEVSEKLGIDIKVLKKVANKLDDDSVDSLTRRLLGIKDGIHIVRNDKDTKTIDWGYSSEFTSAIVATAIANK